MHLVVALAIALVIALVGFAIAEQIDQVAVALGGSHGWVFSCGNPPFLVPPTQDP